MDKRKHLWSLARVGLPSFGFSLICLGAYLLSLHSDTLYTLRVIISYILIITGFLLLLTGVFWSIFHGMRSKICMQHERLRRDTQSHIYTVDRPDFYPPSYEESQARNGALDSVTTENELQPGMAPPLYTQSSSEALNLDFSHEEPPSYQDAVLEQEPE